MNMRLLGAHTIRDVVPAMVDASSVSLHTAAVPEDRLYGGNCASGFTVSFHLPMCSTLTISYPRVAQMRALLGHISRKPNYKPGCADACLRPTVPGSMHP